MTHLLILKEVAGFSFQRVHCTPYIHHTHKEGKRKGNNKGMRHSFTPAGERAVPRGELTGYQGGVEMVRGSKPKSG